MTKKKKTVRLPPEEGPPLSDAEVAEILARAPAGIAPRTTENPTGALTRDPAGIEPPPPPPPAMTPEATTAVRAVGPRLDKGHVWEIEPLWTGRVERMAEAAGLPPDRFLDTLLRKAWVSLPLKSRGGP